MVLWVGAQRHLKGRQAAAGRACEARCVRAYVLACSMTTQDGCEHTQLGMERTIRIVK
jgi:hypothetical protein